MSFQPDLVILGSGTTAFAAALRAAELGAKTLMVEQGTLGGTCINWGCVPSKTLIHKASLYHAAHRGEAYGLNLSAGPVAPSALMTCKRQAMDQVRLEHYQAVLDANPDIRLINGHGQFINRNTLQVGPDIVHAERFLIACGGRPRALNLPGLDQAGYLNSYSALNLDRLPSSLIIIGGGVIALELGQMFQRLGCRTMILERGERPLAEFDQRLTAQLCGLLANEGLHQVFGVETLRVESAPNAEVRVFARVHERETRFQAERIMLAVGTTPATQGIGLEAAGVDVSAQGFVVVDREMRTSAAGIWAAGDVTGPPLLAPAGEREGEVAVENMLTGRHRQVDHLGTPMGVFTDPEIAMVRQNAEQAKAAGYSVEETYLDLSAVAKAHIVGQTKGALLLWVNRPDGLVLGAQVLAPRAADIIHEAALAIRAGLSIDALADLVHVYPTISDGWRLAARQCLAQLAAES